MVKIFSSMGQRVVSISDLPSDIDQGKLYEMICAGLRNKFARDLFKWEMVHEGTIVPKKTMKANEVLTFGQYVGKLQSSIDDSVNELFSGDHEVYAY